MFLNFLNNKKTLKKNCAIQRGFTILEFIIYFTMTLIMIGFLVQIAINIFTGKEKAKAYQEVSRNGRNVLEEIANTISESESVEGVVSE